jgi:hypothetical protein
MSALTSPGPGRDASRTRLSERPTSWCARGAGRPVPCDRVPGRIGVACRGGLAGCRDHRERREPDAQGVLNPPSEHEAEGRGTRQRRLQCEGGQGPGHEDPERRGVMETSRPRAVQLRVRGQGREDRSDASAAVCALATAERTVRWMLSAPMSSSAPVLRISSMCSLPTFTKSTLMFLLRSS